MWPYLLVCVLVMLFSFLDFIRMPSRIKKLAYFFLYIVLTLFLGTATIGPDLWTYESFYIVTPPLPSLLLSYGYYTMQSLFEPLFLLSYGVFIWLGFSFKGFILLFTSAYMAIFFVSLRKYTTYLFIGVSVFMAYGYFYGFSAIRQVMAASIFFYAIHFLSIGNIKKYMLYIVLASLFHISAIVLLVFCFVHKWRAGSRTVLVAVLGSVGLVISGILGRVAGLFMSVVPFFPESKVEQYLSEESQLFGGVFVFWIVVLILCLAFKKEMNHLDSRFNLFFNILWIGFVIYIISVGLGGFGRIVLYFKLVYIIIVPMLIRAVKELEVRFVANFLIGTLVISMFALSIRADLQYSSYNRYLPYRSWLFGGE